MAIAAKSSTKKFGYAVKEDETYGQVDLVAGTKTVASGMTSPELAFASCATATEAIQAAISGTNVVLTSSNGSSTATVNWSCKGRL